MSKRWVVVGAHVLLWGTLAATILDVWLFLAGMLSDTIMIFQTLLLSWLALTFTAADLLQTSRVHRDVGDDE